MKKILITEQQFEMIKSSLIEETKHQDKLIVESQVKENYLEVDKPGNL